MGPWRLRSRPRSERCSDRGSERPAGEAEGAGAAVPRRAAVLRRARRRRVRVPPADGPGRAQGRDRRERGIRARDRLDVVAYVQGPEAGCAPRTGETMTTVDSIESKVESLVGEPGRIRAPRGSELNARSWSTEAPLRMLLNNLDPEVAERPEELVVYGGSGKAARDPESLRALVRCLLRLGDDETLLVQSGKPVGVFRTHVESPRVLIANSLLVPRWATWDEFRRLEALGLTMFGQMTAGSWIYIGTQGILQGTYETFAECARQHFGGTLEGRLVVTGGLGGMGGAQPLAAKMNGAAFLGVDVDESRIRRRVESRYCDRLEHDLDTALRLVEDARARRRPLAVGLVGNIAEVLPELVRRGVVPDVLTDQTSAHDLRVGYIPTGLSLEAAAELREQDPA